MRCTVNSGQSQRFASVVEPYNTVSCVHSLLEHTDDTVVMYNVPLDDISRRYLDIERPIHTHQFEPVARAEHLLIYGILFLSSRRIWCPTYAFTVLQLPVDHLGPIQAWVNDTGLYGWFPCFRIGGLGGMKWMLFLIMRGSTTQACMCGSRASALEA